MSQTSSLETARKLAEAIAPVFAVENVTTGLGDGQVVRLQGRLLTDSRQAYSHIETHFKDLGFTPLLRQQDGEVRITAVPVVFAATRSRDAAALVLFGLTVLSVLFAGASGQAPDVAWILRHPLVGLPFAAGMIAVLAAHELGHYFTARRLGVAVSLPYFIPMPLSPFGTMGAVIRMRGPVRSRRQLLAIGAAGPIAGLAVAIPLLIVGLVLSEVQRIPSQPGTFMEGNSLLYAGLKLAVFGRLLPQGGYDVYLHPVAFAAWAGLFVTALNLIPAGQLDGGHIAYALLGRKTRWLNRAAVVIALALGFLWSGWFLWAAILLLLGQRSAEPLDDVTTLTAGQKMVAVCLLVLFCLLFTPVPMSIL